MGGGIVVQTPTAIQITQELENVNFSDDEELHILKSGTISISNISLDQITITNNQPLFDILLGGGSYENATNESYPADSAVVGYLFSLDGETWLNFPTGGFVAVEVGSNALIQQGLILVADGLAAAPGTYNKLYWRLVAQSGQTDAGSWSIEEVKVSASLIKGW